MVVADVDGTLVGSGGEVHPAVWEAADRARDAGLVLGLCTGRPAFGVTESLARRFGPSGWHVFQNGASVVNTGTGHSLSSPMDAHVVEGLVQRARETGRLLEVYTDSHYAFELDTELSRAHAQLLGVPFRPRPFESLTGPVVRALWVVPEEEVASVLSVGHAALSLFSSTSPVMPGTQFINLTAAGVDKASALRTVASECGVALDEVMFVGDSLNDIPPMRLVGFPVAMGNAEPRVRELAGRTVGEVDGGGLAEALEWAMERAVGG